MEITDIKIRKLITEGRLKAVVSITLDNMLAVHDIKIDSDDPKNIPGEIQARGRNITLGYFKNPEANAAAFTEDGWFRTGDLGIMDEKNNIFIYEYFIDLPAVVAYLKENGVITKDANPTKEAITAVLSEIEEERPDDVSYMLEEFVVVED